MVNSIEMSMESLPLSISKESLRLELARRSLLDFTTYTFPGYRVNWHHRVLCDALDDLIFGETNRLMIFTPPRHGKSELVSRRLPSFFLGNFPSSEVILSSYSADLANRMNGNVQLIMDSPEYRRVFPHVRLPGGIGDPSRKLFGGKRTRTQEYFELVGNRGSLRSAGVGGGITGMGFNLGIIDDPLKDAEEAMSQVIRDKTWDWYQSTFWTRQTGFGGTGGHAKILLTMTRWHEDDLAGRLLRLARTEPGADQWKVIRLPALSGEILDEYDERLTPGRALWETSLYNTQWMNKAKKNMANFFWQAMYQQRPVSEGAGYFKEGWFRGRFKVSGEWIVREGQPPISIRECLVVAAVDPAASEKEKADFTVVLVMAITPDGDGLILEIIRERVPPNGIPALMHMASTKWPVRYFVFEANNFQTAVVAVARRDYQDLPPIREVKHGGKGKLVRATSAMVRAENGNLLLLDKAPWIDDFVEELCLFTGEDDRHDDQVDALAYAVNEIGRFGGLEWADVEQGKLRPGAEFNRASSAQRRGLWGRGR